VAATAVTDILFWAAVVAILVAFVAGVALIVLDPRARPGRNRV
jgi:cytochrome b subunit of formate dehydrogenase